MTAPGLTIEPAETAEDIGKAKALILAYNRFLPVDLRFQDFEEEMRTFPAVYGRVLVAKSGEAVVGCVCLKKLNDTACEMKRLFVAPEARGSGIGRGLAERIIAEAKTLGFAEIKLDTLERLKAAGALYRSLGFEPIAPYNDNPEPDVVYYAKELT